MSGEAGQLLSVAGSPPGLFLLGVCAGRLVALFLRCVGLRWTWALPGALLSYLVFALDHRAGALFAVATFTAARRGARAHAELLEHGGEEASHAEDFPGPLRWTWGRLSRHRACRREVRGGGLAIGTTRRGGVCRVSLGHGRCGAHALLVGATGSGKTVTQAAIAQAYVLAGQAAIVIDPKGDAALRSTLEDAAASTGADFRTWSPTGTTVYNPLGRGGVTEIADKALSGHEWSEPHYRLATQRLLGQALATMQAAGRWPPTLSQLATYMHPDRLDGLAREVGGETKQRVSAYLDGLSQRARSDLGGGRDRLAVLVESELGPCLDPALGDGELLDLRDTITAGEVLYVDLPADRYPAACELLGAALVIDLASVAKDLHEGGHPSLVLIDEFSGVSADQVSRLFARCRSAGMSLVLGTQALADLRAARPQDATDTLTEQVLANVSYLIAHRISDPDSAELLARTAGTRPAWSVTERVRGRRRKAPLQEGTRTREREFIVWPDQFKRLGTGEAVVINPKARRPGEIVRVWAPRTAVGGAGAK